MGGGFLTIHPCVYIDVRNLFVWTLSRCLSGIYKCLHVIYTTQWMNNYESILKHSWPLWNTAGEFICWTSANIITHVHKSEIPNVIFNRWMKTTDAISETCHVYLVDYIHNHLLLGNATGYEPICLENVCVVDYSPPVISMRERLECGWGAVEALLAEHSTRTACTSTHISKPFYSYNHFKIIWHIIWCLLAGFGLGEGMGSTGWHSR